MSEPQSRHFESLAAMKSGPREYTPEQFEFIGRVVSERQPLDVEPLPVEDGAQVACPNGHPFASMTAVRCTECEAQVACVPFAEVLRLRELLNRARFAICDAGLGAEIDRELRHGR